MKQSQPNYRNGPKQAVSVLKVSHTGAAAETSLWAKGAYVSSNYQTVETQAPTGVFKAEALAPVVGSFSGLGGLLAGNGPVQWALATIMVLAAGAGIFFVDKRFQEHRL